jgi:FAD:protein FMN transferase
MSILAFRRTHLALGTNIILSIRRDDARPLDLPTLEAASKAAFARIDHIGRIMSAHSAASDLGRIASAPPHSELLIDPLTMVVLKLSDHWRSLSLGAFNAIAAGNRLAQLGLRPGLAQSHSISPFSPITESAKLSNYLLLLSGNRLKVIQPCRVDFGGIAKGFAVDQAVAVLQQFGVSSALINAGGDIRALGGRPWRIEVRHPHSVVVDHPRASVANGIRRRRGNFGAPVGSTTTIALSNAAIATSATDRGSSEYVSTKHLGSHSYPRLWRHCSAQAPTCVIADILTKWGLQEQQGSARFSRTLKQVHAHLWRSS